MAISLVSVKMAHRVDSRIEEEETECRHCVAGNKDRVILPSDRGESFGRKLIEK